MIKCQKEVRLAWECKKAIFFKIMQWSRFVFAESKIWIKCNQIETFGFWSLQSNYWMVQKQSKYWMVQKWSKYWIAFHESKFWIACSNYRLNHPIYGLLGAEIVASKWFNPMHIFMPIPKTQRDSIFITGYKDCKNYFEPDI